MALLLLSAFTFIEIEGNSNSIGDSGNHSGFLNVPELGRTRKAPLSRMKAP
ncbi:hypothetical protein [Caballeronia sp. ATUFL_F1_KS4A]|uniref:hypothetical protein n=1 Tax=Caballeronia sp. ATUFL_F1_KS4A TaxID=2921768 RepID=UPI002027FB27|nr:hypothetical protein [Caballeronia sp. ATUFL_F1_KS4A]